MEKTVGTSELLEVIVETEAEAGVTGLSVAGGGKQGLFVKDVLRGSPAAQAWSLREGDQLLSARVYFDNMKYEDALQILKSAEPYKVSFLLKRTVPGTDVTRSPAAPTFEVRGPKAKMAKLNIRSLTSLRKKKKKTTTKAGKKAGKGMARGSKLEGGPPVDVEFSLPKFSKLRKARRAGEVAAAAAQPSLDLSPLLSSLETKRRKLKLPRLKVKEALAARAAGRLDGAPPKAAAEKASRFNIPFSKGKKPKEEAGFQAPQVELDLPLPRVGPGRGSPREGPAGHVLPQVELVLPQGSPAAEAPPERLLAGLRVPVAEVAAPNVAVSLPGLEGSPEAAPKIRVPKAKEAEQKPALLGVVLGKGRGKAEGGPEEKAAMPFLDVGLPPVDVEIPLPRGKAEAEAPKPKMQALELSIKVPTVSLPKLGSKPQEVEVEEESRVPQVELSVGKRESPKALTERRAEGREAPAESKSRSLALKVPSLDISAPKIADMQLPKALGGPAAPEVKPEEATEGPRFKLHMPQVSLPKSSGLPAKGTPSPPRVPKKLEGEAVGKGGGPALSLSLPATKPLGVQLPTVSHVLKPELGLCVDRPEVELALPAARLSFPPAAAPALELDVPRVGIELGLPKADGSGHPPGGAEAKLKVPSLEALSQELAVEICVPTCRAEQPGGEATEGLGVGDIVAKIPQVGLALGQEDGAEAAVTELEGPAKGRGLKLPSVEVSAVKLPQVAAERGQSPEAEAKLKLPKFALPKFSLSGPKAWKVGGTELFGPPEAAAAAERGPKLKMPKFGLSFPKPKGGADAEGPKPASGEGRRSAEEEPAESRMKLPSLPLPTVDVEAPKLGIGLPTGKADSPDEEGTLELPDSPWKMPKFSLARLGGRGKEGPVELETGEALLGERGAKASKFKVGLFSGEGRATKGAESPKEKSKVRLPKLKLPSPKAELGQGLLPQVELPTIGLPEAKAEEAPLMGAESPSLKVKVPSLEMALPGTATKAEPAPGRPRAEASEAELKVPQAPSLQLSAPKVELDLRLPTVGPEAKIQLPRFGRGEAAEAQLPSQGGGGEQIRVPQVDLALPSAQLPGEGGKALPMPSVELPKFCSPQARDPEQEGGLRLPRVRGPSWEGAGEGETGLPQLELKVPKLGGSAERLGPEVPPSSFGLCVALAGEEEGAALGPDSKFKLQMPSLSLSKAGGEPRADTQPLCPSVPPMALPEVGFSVDQDGQREARVKAGKLASAEGLQGEGWLKVPKIKMPALGVSIPRGGQDAATPPGPEGKKAAFHVPGLELAAPSLKTHAEYAVEGAQIRSRGSQELEMAGGRRDGQRSPGGGGGETLSAEAGRKYKVKIPKFELSLPKAAGEGAGGQEAKAKRPAFALGRPKGRGAEGSSSSGLLEGEEEAGGKGVMGRFKLGLARLKTGSEEEEEEDGGREKMQLPQVGFSKGEGAEDGKLGKIRLPQLELSSPSPTVAQSDPELSLQLVGPSEGPGPFAALKFRPPQITFSGFKKRNGVPAPGEAEKPPKFRFPKVALSPKSRGGLEIASLEGQKVHLPQVGFSEEAGGGSPPAGGKGEATAAV
ncbi:periaxin [Heteronotia binoei]|uniref:periaxin n=1 Tax=Heteronotia binoei TaxID=13085 RepID=UPI00292CD624|nr:periaxin [Heteronotia binoei]